MGHQEPTASVRRQRTAKQPHASILILTTVWFRRGGGGVGWWCSCSGGVGDPYNVSVYVVTAAAVAAGAGGDTVRCVSDRLRIGTVSIGRVASRFMWPRGPVLAGGGDDDGDGLAHEWRRRRRRWPRCRWRRVAVVGIGVEAVGDAATTATATAIGECAVVTQNKEPPTARMDL